MGENSKIEWTDHTSSGERLVWRPQRKSIGVDKPVTPFAERHAIPHVEPQFRMPGKAADVMGVQVTAPVVAAMATTKAVARVNVVAPSLKLSARPQATSFNTLAVNVARRISSPRCVRASGRTDLSARLDGMLLAETVARLPFTSGAHLCPTLVGHALPFHRRQKCSPALDPRLPYDFTSRKGLVSHGR